LAPGESGGNRIDGAFQAALNFYGGSTHRPTAFYRPAMAIYRLIANGSFGPDEIKAMTAAYEAALVDLGLVDRDDPITQIVATAIVGIAGTGELDPLIIKERALNTLGARRFGVNAGRPAASPPG
jgi:hypothetical protein